MRRSGWQGENAMAATTPATGTFPSPGWSADWKRGHRASSPRAGGRSFPRYAGSWIRWPTRCSTVIAPPTTWSGRSSNRGSPATP